MQRAYGSALLFGETKISGSSGTFEVVAELSQTEYSAYEHALSRLNKILIDSHSAHFTIAVRDFSESISCAGQRLAQGPVPGTGLDSILFLRHRFANSLLSVCSLLFFEQDKTLNQVQKNFGRESNEFVKAQSSYHKLFDMNFGYRFLMKLRNIMHHDTMDVLDIKVHAVANGDKREGAADVRLVRTPLIESRHCNQTLKAELNELPENPMAMELMLQAMIGLKVVSRHLSKLVEPDLDEHCQAMRSFEQLFAGKRGQRMLGEGTIKVIDGRPKLPNYSTVDREILAFSHGKMNSIPSFEYETVPNFDAENFSNQLP